MFKYIILFLIPLNLSYALSPKACLKKYTRRKFQLVVHMAMAKKKKDFKKFSVNQSEYTGLVQAEQILKELTSKNIGKYVEDLYLMLRGKKTPSQINAILNQLYSVGGFCYLEGKQIGLLTYDDLIGLIQMVKGP